MSALTSPLPLSDDRPDELLSRAITPPLDTIKLSIEETYEIERTMRLLTEGNFKTVALQFPDDILHHAATVSRRLQERLEGVKTYILADTSYGRYGTLAAFYADLCSCCVDEVAAEHINADVIVHYGRACLSPYVCTCIALMLALRDYRLFMYLADEL
jgi:diphthamide biosynthesis enzyme Dph1/Dph2-like protein